MKAAIRFRTLIFVANVAITVDGYERSQDWYERVVVKFHDADSISNISGEYHDGNIIELMTRARLLIENIVIYR